MNAGDPWALAGWAIVASAVVATVVPRTVGARVSVAVRSTAVAALVAALLVMAVAPVARFGVDGLTWAAIWRGHASDPSAPLVLLAAWRLLGQASGRGRAVPPSTDLRMLLAVAGIAGWALIVTHLGSDRWDLYRLGQSGWILPGACAVLALAAAASGWARCALALAGGLAAWGWRLPESTNLWDALVDPWLTLLATGWWLRHGVQRLRRRAF